MKEENFKFKARYAEAMKNMSNKQAGEYARSVTEYAFQGKTYSGKDKTVKTAFDLTKATLDEEKFYKEQGRLGARKLLEQRQEEERENILKSVVGGMLVGEIIKEAMAKNAEAKNGGYNHYEEARKS